jgi:hypothetical protein
MVLLLNVLDKFPTDALDGPSIEITRPLFVVGL